MDSESTSRSSMNALSGVMSATGGTGDLVHDGSEAIQDLLGHDLSL